MKKQIKIIVSILMLCAFSLSLFACSNEDKYPLAPVEAGLRYERRLLRSFDESYSSTVHCGYRFEKNQYETNTDIPFTLYYGVNLSARLPQYEQFEKKYPVHIYFRVDSEFTTIKSYTFEEMFCEKYDVSIKYEKSENGEISVLTYNHNEPMSVPCEMLTGERGIIAIGIASVEKLDSELSRNADFSGFEEQILYYRIENGKVYLSSQYTLISE